MSQNISQDKIKLNLARIKRFGNTFEINIDPEAALKYKDGEISDLNEVLLADNIFADAKKGQIAPNDQLEEAFKTTDVAKIADIILKEGEIQDTSERRAEEREQKRRQLINMIHKQAIDSKTGLPHPPARIEAAMEEGGIQVDDHKTTEEQFDEIIAKLRPIIPIRIEQKELSITIPGEFAGKLQQFIRNNKLLQEDWTADGSWKVKIEIPAGMALEFIDKLNSLTHGQAIVEETGTSGK